MKQIGKNFGLTMLLLLVAFVGSNLAQSRNQDNPTPLASGELQGTLGDGDKEFYYSFTAGPGRVSVTVDLKATEGVASMTLNFLDARSTDLLTMPLATHKGSIREVQSFNLTRRQTVVMKLASTGSYNGSYNIRLDGAVNFDSDETSSPHRSASSDFSEDCIPKSGTLRFVMRDGTVQEINLSRVQRVTHKP